MARVTHARKLIGFFQRRQGRHSPIRLGAFCALITAIAIGLITVTLGAPEGVVLTLSCLFAAFGTKAARKFVRRD